MVTPRSEWVDRRFLFILAFVSAWTPPVSGQEVAGSLAGRVLSVAKEPQTDAQIMVSGPNLLGTRASRTDKDGFFRMLALPPGDYAVRISKIGIRPLIIEHVKIRVGETTTIGSVETEAQAVELSEIHVTAMRRTVDPVHTTVGGTLDSADYSALPSDRDYKSIIAVLPQVNLSYYGDAVNVSGSTGPENMYFLDGVNVTSPLDAATGTSLPHNFIRAVEVKAGGFEAEYGKALGGVVNAVTYSGTNERDGQAFAYLTTRGLGARPKSLPDLREINSASYDFGWRLGGPVRRDKLWYSVAYNPRIEHIDKEISGLGVYRERKIGNVFAGKLTWAAAPEANVELSLFGDPTTYHRVSRPPYATGSGITSTSNVDPYLTRAKSGGVTESLRTSWPFGASFVAEGSLAHSSGMGGSSAETVAGGTEALYLDLVTGALGGGLGPFDSWSQKRSSATLRGTALLGRHTSVVGVEYEDSEVFREIGTTGGGTITRYDSASYQVVYEGGAGAFHNRVPTVYFQDAWRVADPLTVSAGVRWSEEALTGASGRIAQRFVGEWQPRLGMSWQFGRSGRQRLMASLGRFYQQVPLNTSTLNYVDYYFIQRKYIGDPRQPGSTLVSTFDGTTYEVDFARSIRGLKAENLDEITLGYEALLGSATKVTLRGIQRNLRSSFGFGIDYSRNPIFFMGTPGKGDLSFLPAPKRNYTALEVSAIGEWRRMTYRASYVLSRDWGNYSGLYNSDILGPGGPNNPIELSHSEQAKNSTGWLPNDRRHVLKLTSFYDWPHSFTSGAFLTWASGTPLNDFGAAPNFPVLRPTFLAPRGSVGRTPSLWDLNVRFSCDVRWITPAGGRLVLDILHLGNPQQVVAVDQAHFTAVDSTGTQINPNPNYLKPLVFQPPMIARLGLELGF